MSLLHRVRRAATSASRSPSDGVRPLSRQQLFQFGQVERLQQHVVESGLQAAAAVLLTSEPRNGNEERVQQADFLSQTTSDRIAVHRRQGEVQQHDVGQGRAGQSKGGGAVVGGAGLVPQHGYDQGQAVGGVVVIVYNQDT